MQSLSGKIRQTINSLKNVDFISIGSLESKFSGHFSVNSSRFNSRLGSTLVLVLTQHSFRSTACLPKLKNKGKKNRSLGMKEIASTYSGNNAIGSKAPSYGSLSLGLTQSPSKLFTLPTRSITTMGSASQEASTSEASQRIKFKRLDKTARHIMQILDKEAVEEVREKREIPDIRPGYIVQLKLEVPENKRRVSVIKGVVIARRNAGLNTTFRIRRLVAGVGVESLFPLYSPNIKEIKVVEKKKVRRAKLYYLRDKMNALKKQ